MVEALTTGRRYLWLVLQRTSAVEVAARCGVVKSCVSEWLAGKKCPSSRSAMRLQTIYGIPPAAWLRQRAGFRRHVVR